MIGVSLRENIGIGDKVQFSSLPENYFKTHGEYLFDVSGSWVFDHNPYVVRERDDKRFTEITEVRELWNFPKRDPWPNPRLNNDDPMVYLSNAEITAARFNSRVFLNRPRLYCFEDYPFEKRELILFHPFGRSHGTLPKEVIQHVIDKYEPTGNLYQVGLPTEPGLGIKRLATSSIWDLVELISKARMFIGADSGPSWVAACFPDVVVKKCRNRIIHGQKPMHSWIPLEQSNIHAHWDDRIFQISTTTEDDCGAFSSFRRL